MLTLLCAALAASTVPIGAQAAAAGIPTSSLKRWMAKLQTSGARKLAARGRALQQSTDSAAGGAYGSARGAGSYGYGSAREMGTYGSTTGPAATYGDTAIARGTTSVASPAYGSAPNNGAYGPMPDGAPTTREAMFAAAPAYGDVANDSSYGGERSAATTPTYGDDAAPTNLPRSAEPVVANSDGERAVDAAGEDELQIDRDAPAPAVGTYGTTRAAPAARSFSVTETPEQEEVALVPDVDPNAPWASKTSALPCMGASVKRNGKCAGVAGRRQFAVRAPCENPEDLCMVKNAFHAQCVSPQRYERKIRQGWPGDVLACPKA